MCATCGCGNDEARLTTLVEPGAVGRSHEHPDHDHAPVVGRANQASKALLEFEKGLREREVGKPVAARRRDAAG